MKLKLLQLEHTSSTKQLDWTASENPPNSHSSNSLSVLALIRPLPAAVVAIAGAVGRFFLRIDTCRAKMEDSRLSEVDAMRLSILIAILFTLPIQADEFVLRNGQRVAGTLLNSDEKPRKTYRIQLDSGGKVTLDADTVSKVVVPSPQQQAYKKLLAKLPAETSELHWKMAQQCAKWSLTRERKFHLEQTVRLDPDHELARRALKHKRRQDGSWATISEIREEAGEVRQGGRWVSKQEAQLNAAMEERKEAEVQWKKKIKMWRGWLKDRRRQQKALAEISAIDDPMAVDPLVDLFRSDENLDLRLILAGVLAQFDHGAATQALVDAALYGKRELQLQCVRQLQKNGRYAAAQRFLPTLKNSNNNLVRRAGYALGELGDEQFVLPLIKALQTSHTKIVGGAGDGRINLQPSGLSMGKTEGKKVSEVKNNKEVRNALVKLTDQDFEYNKQRWLAWYLSKNTPKNLDLRRDE